MVLRSAWSDDLVDQIRSNAVRELELNYAKGWQGKDVIFLAKLTELMSLGITNLNIRDISPIHDLHHLRALDINTYCKTRIDFFQFPVLQAAGLEWRKGAESLFASQQLEKLFINKLKVKNLSVFKQLQRLASLNLKNLGILEIGDINMPTLTSLKIGNARKLSSLEGIEGFPNLARLEIIGCRAITNIEPLASLRHLEWLCLGDDGAVPSLAPIATMTNLKEFHFFESTKVLDGDLAPLKQLPGLQSVSFQERRHYNLRRKDFPIA